MFNLTAYSVDGVNFTLEQLENWYYLGTIRDYSGYTTTDITFDRIKPYKKIDFQYQKSESLMNRGFYDLFNREYGNLNYGFPNNDGQDYVVNLPFENMLFSKAPLNVGYALKPDYVPYKPKPIVMYYNGLYNRGIFFNDGSTTANLVTVNLFCSDMEDSSDNNEKNSLNWGVENSSLYNVAIDNTLFANYYLAYLNNLYSLKSRLVKVKMRLPYLEMLNLKLNDRIVIRDKRYVINQYTTDLTTFETDMELIQDFRSINYNNSTIRTTDNSVQILRFNTTSLNPLIWTIESDPEGLITTLTNGDTYVDVQIKANVSGLERIATIVSNLDDRIIIVQDA